MRLPDRCTAVSAPATSSSGKGVGALGPPPRPPGKAPGGGGTCAELSTGRAEVGAGAGGGGGRGCRGAAGMNSGREGLYKRDRLWKALELGPDPGHGRAWLWLLPSPSCPFAHRQPGVGVHTASRTCPEGQPHMPVHTRPYAHMKCVRVHGEALWRAHTRVFAAALLSNRACVLCAHLCVCVYTQERPQAHMCRHTQRPPRWTHSLLWLLCGATTRMYRDGCMCADMGSHGSTPTGAHTCTLGKFLAKIGALGSRPAPMSQVTPAPHSDSGLNHVTCCGAAGRG